MQRVVKPEILDGLDPMDPEAVRSRRDLRMINFLMGNERWISRQVKAMPELARDGIVEWGAGSGDLVSRLAGYGPASGVDLMPRPAGLAEEISWKQGSVFDQDDTGGILVANLFLHHFKEGELAQLGQVASQFGAMIFVEPLRKPGSLALGRGMLPLVNRVTKHDMIVSIEAGFIAGELAGMLGLNPAQWNLSERCSWRGGLRVLASRV